MYLGTVERALWAVCRFCGLVDVSLTLALISTNLSTSPVSIQAINNNLKSSSFIVSRMESIAIQLPSDLMTISLSGTQQETAIEMDNPLTSLEQAGRDRSITRTLCFRYQALI